MKSKWNQSIEPDDVTKRQGYLVLANASRNASKASAWMCYCERQRIPYIRISPGKPDSRPWARVELDMAPTGERLSAVAMERIGQLIFAEREQQSPRAHVFFGWSDVSLAMDMAMDRVEPFALGLLAAIRVTETKEE
jgi:hypothetical protein